MCGVVMVKIQYPGYPMNVYNDLSSDKKQKQEKYKILMDQIGLCP